MSAVLYPLSWISNSNDYCQRQVHTATFSASWINHYVRKQVAYYDKNYTATYRMSQRFKLKNAQSFHQKFGKKWMLLQKLLNGTFNSES